MQKVRAKFRCDNVTPVSGCEPENHLYVINMSPVYSDDPASENKVFTKYTPAGGFHMNVTVPETAAFFVPGQEYYLDFSKS